MWVTSLAVAVLLLTAPDAQVKKARDLEAKAHQLQIEGKFVEARQPLLDAIAIWNKRGAEDRIEVLNDQVNLAVSYRRHGELAKAAEQLESTTAELEKLKHPDAPRILRVGLNDLATADWLLDKPADARKLWLRCLAMEKEQDEGRARILDNLAALETDDDLDLAEKYAAEAYGIWVALRGKEDVDVAISTSTRGTIAMRAKKYDQARALLEESLRVTEKLLGKNHPNVGAVLNLLGELELRVGRRDAARAAYERSYAIAKASLSTDAPQLQDAKAGLEKLGLTPKN